MKPFSAADVVTSINLCLPCHVHTRPLLRCPLVSLLIHCPSNCLRYLASMGFTNFSILEKVTSENHSALVGEGASMLSSHQILHPYVNHAISRFCAAAAVQVTHFHGPGILGGCSVDGWSLCQHAPLACSIYLMWCLLAWGVFWDCLG